MSETPQNPAYTAEDYEKIERIQLWLDGGHTAAELSRLTGIKDGTRSSILNYSYASSPTKQLDKMLDAIEQHMERERAGNNDIPFTPTSIATTIERVCKRAHADRDFGFYAGRVGIGKTRACREYVRKTPSAVLIEAFEGIDHTTFLDELIAAIGKTVGGTTLSSKMANLIRSLKDAERLIVVDEANWLPKRSFGALRRISDMAGIGIVLIGTPDLLEMVQDPDGRFGQISSRIGYWPQVKHKISDDDARLLVMSFLDDGVDDAVARAFYACCEGSARTLRNLLRNTQRAAKKQKSEITPEFISKINSETMAGRSFTVRGGAQ